MWDAIVAVAKMLEMSCDCDDEVLFVLLLLMLLLL
jgi:hypothetical protein